MASFRDLPISYRIAQGGIATCFVGWFILARFGIRGWPPNLIALIYALFAAVVTISLVVAYYVIIRYPFVSLAGTNNFFTNNVSDASKIWGRLLGGVGIFVLLAFSLTIVFEVMGGGVNENPVQIIMKTVYALIMLPFAAFLTIFYRTAKHPTIATYIEVTLGVGVIFAPLFLPAILIGSVRCNRLLNTELHRLDLENKTG